MTETTKYITGVVIANGVPDSDGDILNKKDIKIISTKYRNHLTDVMHNRIKNEGVDIIYDWITDAPTQLGGMSVPTGSWMVSMAVSNTEILTAINEGSINGLSLGSVSEEALNHKNWFINKSQTYSDLLNMEQVIPLFISFVDKPANQYPLEVSDYDVFINKRENSIRVDNMTENKIEDEKVSISTIQKIREMFSIDKAEEVVDVETAPAEEAPSKDDKLEVLFEKLDTIIEQNKIIIEAVSGDAAPAEGEEESIDKSEDENPEDKKDDEPTEEDESVNKNESGAEGETSETDTETSEEEPEEETDDDEKPAEINKRQTEMPINTTNDIPETNFYKRTGRDHFGRKIRH